MSVNTPLKIDKVRDISIIASTPPLVASDIDQVENKIRR